MESRMPAPRGAEVWRDYKTDGIPSSGINEPKKADARAWSTWLESLVTSGVLSSGPWFATQASMTLTYAPNTIAVVYADPDAAKNGLYRKNGASGSGSWTQLTSFLPGYQFVTATPAGASTANAIVATTSPRLPAGNGVALVSLLVPHTNTATPVTVSFDGGSPLTIKTRSGEDPAIGEIQAGDIVSGFVSGSTFRLIVDPNSLIHMQGAREWANNAENVPVSAAAGGDGATTFSARHWAVKAEDSADIAAGFASDIVSQGNVPIFDSRETAETYDLSAFSAVIINRFTSSSSVAPASYAPVAQPANVEPTHPFKFQSDDGRWWEMGDTTLHETVTVGIPSDFPTLQSAIDFFSGMPVRRGVRIVLTIETGHAIATGLVLEGGDFSKFDIVSEDAEVLLTPGFSGDVVRGINAQMPTLGCLINAQNQIAENGVYLTGACTMSVRPGCGVKNAWNTGLLARGGCAVYAHASIWTGCARNGTTGAGITAWGARVDATSGDVSNSGYYGAQAAHGGTLTFEFGKANDVYRYGIRASDAACIDFSDGEAHRAGVYGIYSFQNSHVNAPGAKATGCGHRAAGLGLDGANACCVNASTLNVRSAVLSGSAGHGLLAVSGKVDAFNANFSSATLDGMNATGTEVHAGGSSASSCRRGYFGTQAATISASIATASNCRDVGFYAERAATIDARDATATGCTNYGAIANEGATINAKSATLSGAGAGGIRAVGGSKINATGANCQKGGSPDTGLNTADIQCFSGSQIIAQAATGGLNRVANTLTANGVIFQ